jgi:hypothetical protein
MAVLITDPRVEDALLAERRATGADRYDEVWEGVYWIPPMPNIEHQGIAARLAAVFLQFFDFDPRIQVFAGANVADQEEDWTYNYRVPDIAVYLERTLARNRGTHWLGGPDFALRSRAATTALAKRFPSMRLSA